MLGVVEGSGAGVIKLIGAVVLAASVLASSCDPGTSYVPSGWQQLGNGMWQLETPDMRIGVWTLSGLRASTSLVAEGRIFNRASAPLVIEHARLTYENGSTMGILPANGAVAYRTVAPGDTKRIVTEFDFERSLSSALPAEVELVIAYKIGNENRELSVKLIRR